MTAPGAPALAPGSSVGTPVFSESAHRVVGWLGRWWFAGALAAVVLCNFLVVTSADWLPLQDFSAHVELFDILARHDDPATLYPALYAPGAPLVAGGLGPTLARLLGPLTGALFVAQLIVALYLVLTPLALAYVARVFERPRWTVLLAAPLVFNGCFALGLVNFIPAIALALFVVGVARRFAVFGGAWRGGLLALLLLLASFAHVVGYLIALPMAAVVLVLHVPGIGAWRRFLPLVLSSPLFLLWVWDHLVTDAPTGAGRTFLAAEGATGMHFASLEQKLEEIPAMLIKFRAGPDGIALFGILALWLVAMLGTAARAPRVVSGGGIRAALRPYTLELLGLANLLAFFILPVGFGRDSWFIHERWLVVGAFFFPLWIRIAPTRGWALGAVLASVLAVWYPLTVADATRTYARDVVGTLPNAIAALPERSRLGFMTWDGSLDWLRRTPEWHLYKGMHATANGGACDTSFAGLPYNGVDYRPGRAPQRLRYAFYDDINLPAWDLVLMWAKSRPTNALASGRIALRWQEGSWWLFDVLPEPYRSAPLEGGLGGNVGIAPCPAANVVVGLDLVWRDQALAAVRPICSAWGADGKVVATPAANAVWLGSPGNAGETLRCAGTSAVVGLLVRADHVVRGVALRCSDGTRVGPLLAPPGGGAERQVACPPKQIAVGLKARHAALVDALGIACTL